MGWILSALFPVFAYATEGTIEFASIQQACVQTQEVSFGSGQPWSECHVTKAGWVATIGLTDMYQAQYCLGNGQETCAQRAWLLFGNRAYTSKAKILLQRMDAGSAHYDDPEFVLSNGERAMRITAHLADESSHDYYYHWQADQWVSVDNRQAMQ
jgi:hypothetical protein